MADRAFDRAFSRAAAASDVTEAEPQVRNKKQVHKPDTQEATPEATPMQMSDAVQRILQADEQKDYIRYTGLPCSPQTLQASRACNMVCRARFVWKACVMP